MSCLLHTVEDNNFRLCLKSLKCVMLMMEADVDKFRSKTSVWAKKMLGRMSDNKSAVREMATETAFRMVELYGSKFFYEHLVVPGFQHKKSKTREQIAILVSKLANRLVSEESEISNNVLELVVDTLEDSAKEVREAAIRAIIGLAPMYSDPEELVSTLEEYGVRSTQIATIRTELGLEHEEKTRRSPRHQRPSTSRSTSSDTSSNIMSKLSEISKVLKDTSADWERRRDALDTLKDFASNNTINHPSAIEFLGTWCSSTNFRSYPNNNTNRYHVKTMPSSSTERSSKFHRERCVSYH